MKYQMRRITLYPDTICHPEEHSDEGSYKRMDMDYVKEVIYVKRDFTHAFT